MKLALLLHIHQPSTQDPAVTKQIALESYFPLIRTIKQKKNVKFTLNMTLSFLEQMEQCGFSAWIDDVKQLVDAEKIELVGTGAFHPLLSKLPREFVEKQIILNEYSLGYYFGKRKGFEGEPVVIVKDLDGFHPPEVAVNEELISILDSLGYKWTVVDEVAITNTNLPRYGVYALKEYTTLLACRNRALSNLISFKRDLETKDIIDLTQSSGDSLVDMDGEFFGHHHKQGIALLDILVDDLKRAGVEFVTASEYVNEQKPEKIESINESTWGTSDELLSQGVLYPKWDLKDNRIHVLLWEILNKMVEVYKDALDGKNFDGYENIPVWNMASLDQIEQKDVVSHLKHDLIFHKSLHSDQFWWATQLPLSNYWMIEKALEMYSQVAYYLENDDFGTLLTKNSSEIKSLLEVAKNAVE